MMIYSIARMSFTFALTLVARTSVNVVKTCTLSMENAEVIYQFRGSVLGLGLGLPITFLKINGG